MWCLLCVHSVPNTLHAKTRRYMATAYSEEIPMLSRCYSLAKGKHFIHGRVGIGTRSNAHPKNRINSTHRINQQSFDVAPLIQPQMPIYIL